MNKILLIAIIAAPTVLFAMGKKPLIDSRIQLAEQIKLADKVTGLESKIDKVDAKVDGQAVAMAGFNNTVSKVSSELKLSGNNNQVNDSAIFKAQLDAQIAISKIQQQAARDREGTNKQTIYWLVGIITLLVNQLFKFFNKYMAYKEAYIKNLDPKVADMELKKMKAERAERTVLGKVKKMLVKKEKKQ